MAELQRRVAKVADPTVRRRMLEGLRCTGKSPRSGTNTSARRRWRSPIGPEGRLGSRTPG